MSYFGTLLLIVLLAAGGLVACKATRAGYDTAPNTVLSKDGSFSVRSYPELTVAVTGTQPGADDDGRFMRLFRYISGENETGEKIAMTTPVFMTRTADSERMAFVMPENTAAKGAPQAKSGDVKVEKLPAAKYAVYRFSGSLNREAELAALAKLREWMAGQKLKPGTGEPMVAGFDPPFTPPPLRRNEVMIRLAD